MAKRNKILFVFGVLATIWSDASIDKTSLQNKSHLQWDLQGKLYDETSCRRKCKSRQKPRQCHYQFEVDATEMPNEKIALTINGLTPGPPIHACLNDIIIVEVTNKLPGQELAFHWHGMSQKGTPYMDGVPMITQCPITGGTKFKYAFRAGKAGTYFYHAHSVAHQADGLFGAFIVSQATTLKGSTYHNDDLGRSHEHILLLSARFPVTFTSNFDDLRKVEPSELRINGEMDSRFFIESGLKYRFRAINAVPIECSLVLNVDGHELVVVEADGRPTEPTPMAKVLLHPGERVDFVLNANRPPSGYWLRVQGFGGCAGLQQRSLVVYNGFNHTSFRPQIHHITKLTQMPQDALSGQYLLSAHPSPSLSPTADARHILIVDASEIAVSDEQSDYRYLSDALPVPPFYPAQLSRSQEPAMMIQINGKNFLYPNSPILLSERSIPSRIFCSVGYENRTENIECLQTIDLELNSMLELIIVDRGAGSDVSRTFHLHGNPMYVLATSRKSSGRPISVEEVEQLDRDGQIKRNLVNPPRKDTIIVPNKGFVVVRILGDNPGTWLLECRSCGLSSLPAAVLIRVPLHIPKVITDAMPKCDSFRPPDILLN